jgi:hypothetical protein
MEPTMSIEQEAALAPEGGEMSCPAGILTPGRPVRSITLYHLLDEDWTIILK